MTKAAISFIYTWPVLQAAPKLKKHPGKLTDLKQTSPDAPQGGRSFSIFAAAKKSFIWRR